MLLRLQRLLTTVADSLHTELRIASEQLDGHAASGATQPCFTASHVIRAQSQNKTQPLATG